MKSAMRMQIVVLGLAATCCAGSMWAQSKAAMVAGTGTPEADKVFLMKSAQGSMAEVAAGKMALTKSKNDDVKMFAQKMVDDHTMLLANMKPFMDQMGVMSPKKLSKKDMIEAERLKSMSGGKFDKEYVTAMVGDHHKDLGDFMTERDTTKNADLKATVATGTDVIKQHTEMIDGIAGKMGITTPPMPSSM